MNWHRSWRADPAARAIADRHYNRQSVGAAQFVPPGRCLVLVTSAALWVTSWPLAEYVQHAWAGAWICSVFRNEHPACYGGIRSSTLIREGVAATRAELGPPPPEGFITFVDGGKTKRKRDPGRCFLRAGWRYVPCIACASAGCAACDGDGRARTKTERLFVLGLPAAEICEAVAPLDTQMHLWRPRSEVA